MRLLSTPPPTTRQIAPPHEAEFGPLVESQAPASDAELAELIEQDGRWRLDRGLPCGLDRYYTAVPDLPRRPISLDAAIDISLRSIALADGCSAPNERHTECLLRSYPDLAGPIRIAALLSNQLISTAGLDTPRPRAPRDRRLPRWIGPDLDSGRARYELLRPLGRGSSGTVFEAVDHLLSDAGHAAKVAVKLIAIDPATAQKQAAEATKARRIEHPSVVRVLDRGLAGPSELFLVYELVPGGDLQAWFDARQHRIAPRDAAKLVAAIAQGVQAAHSAGLVHCDLKPSNILMTPDGEPRVSDFGVATVSEATPAAALPLGNLAFAAPEQVRKTVEGASPLADIYALGGLLYYLLTGALPNGATPEEVLRTHDAAIGRRTPPSARLVTPAIDARLDRICAKALHPRPDARYATAGELTADLNAWLEHRPVAWQRESVVQRAGLWARRSPALAAVSVACVVLLVGGGFASGYYARARNLAQQEVSVLNSDRALVRDASASMIDALTESTPDGRISPEARQAAVDTIKRIEDTVKLRNAGVVPAPSPLPPRNAPSKK